MPRSRKAKFGLSWVYFGNFKWGQELSNRYRRLSQATATEGTLLLDIELDDKHLYLSDKYITVTHEHEGMVSDWGSMDLSSGSGGISEISDWSITLFNKRLMHMTTDERISDMLDSYNWEGRKATIRQYFAGLTYAECAILMSGRITGIGFDDLNFYFDIVDTEEVFRDVPINRVSRQEFSEAPAESIGMGKPVVYGVPYSNNELERNAWTLWPTILTNTRTHQLIMADHLICQEAIPDEGAPIGRVYIFVPEIKHYMRVAAANAVYSNTAAGAILTLKDPITGAIKYNPTLKGTRYDLVDEDFSNAVDGDFTNTFVLPASKLFYLQFTKFPDFGEIKYGEAYGTFKVNVEAVTGSSPYGTIKYYNPSYNAGVGDYSTGVAITGTGSQNYIFCEDFTAHGSETDQADRNDPWNWGQISDYEWGVTVGAGNTITISEMYLYIWGIVISDQYHRIGRKIRTRTRIP